MFMVVDRIKLGRALDAFRRKHGAKLAVRVLQKVAGTHSIARMTPEDRESAYHAFTDPRALARLKLES